LTKRFTAASHFFLAVRWPLRRSSVIAATGRLDFALLLLGAGDRGWQV
jgi:hypothetical protein